jgi:hypothetical protein
MNALLKWVLARRYRSLLLAIAFAPLFPIVSAALMSLDTARNGAVQGALGGLAGVAAMLALAYASDSDPRTFAILAAVTFGSGVAIGVLLERTGSLLFAFQTTVLFAFVLVGTISVFGLGVGGPFEPVVAWFVEVLRGGGATPEQLEIFAGRGAMVFLAGAVFSQLVGALFLAAWWIGLAKGEKRFGAEFRRLRLGRLLGVLATVVVVLGLVLDLPLVQNLGALALLAFLFQGLAVLHAWAHAKRWHPSLVAPVYVLLVTPLTVLVVLVLSAVGLLDSWFDLRASLRPQA